VTGPRLTPSSSLPLQPQLILPSYLQLIVAARPGEGQVGRQRAEEVSQGLIQHSPHAELVHLGLTDDVSAGVEQGRHAGGIEGRMVFWRC
jgi:hypothetical protein